MSAPLAPTETTETTPAPMTGRELLALGLSVALVPLNSTMLAVAIPSIGLDVGEAPAALTQWLVTSYLLVGIALQSPAGKLGDAIGHGRALSLGQLVFAAGALTGSVGRSLALLVLARCLMAAGGAIMVPSAMALARTRLPPSQRARAFGIFGAVMGLAAAIGPLLGGELCARLGWPALFVVNAPPVLLAAIVRGRAGAEKRSPLHVDVLGSVLLATGLGTIVVGTRVPGFVLPAGALGIALVTLFVFWERRAPHPVVDLSLFGRRAYAAGVAIAALQNLAMYALLFELPIVLTRVTGATSATIGRTLLGMTLAMVVGSLSGGRAASALGPRASALLGGSIACAGAGLLVVLPLRSATDQLPALVCLGLGIGLSTPAAQASSLGAVPPEQSGMAAGVAASGRYVGGAAGIAIVGALLAGGDTLARHRLGAFVFLGALAASLLAAMQLPRDAGR